MKYFTSSETDPVQRYICIEGMVLLSTAFAVYLGCFIVVVQRAALKTDLKRVGYLSIVILSFPLLYASTSAFARFWVYFQNEPGDQCYLYSES